MKSVSFARGDRQPAGMAVAPAADSRNVARVRLVGSGVPVV